MNNDRNNEALFSKYRDENNEFIAKNNKFDESLTIQTSIAMLIFIPIFSRFSTADLYALTGFVLFGYVIILSKISCYVANSAIRKAIDHASDYYSDDGDLVDVSSISEEKLRVFIEIVVGICFYVGLLSTIFWVLKNL